MNQPHRAGHRGRFTLDQRLEPTSINNFTSRTLPADFFREFQNAKPRGLHPGLYDAPPNSKFVHSYYQGISRSTPVHKPRSETAKAFIPFDERAKHSLSRSFPSGKPVENCVTYTVEEHHDASSLFPSAINKRIGDSIPSESAADRRPVDDVLSLLISHSSAYDSSNQSPINIQRFPKNLSESWYNEDEKEFKSFLPQVYRTGEREVERFTYLPSTVSSQRSPESPSRYPIVELSIPKFGDSSSGIANTISPKSPRTIDLGYQNTYKQSASEITLQPASINQTVNTKFQKKEGISSSFTNDSLSRSVYEQFPVQYKNQDSFREKSASNEIDISSLDAFLKDIYAVFPEDMSKTTQEWRTSYSSLRDRFGATLETDQNIIDGFIVQRSMGLAKSASQGTIIFNNDSSKIHEQNSILEGAVERKAAEAPELRSTSMPSRQKLGNFWETTLRTRSSSSSSSRTFAQRNATDGFDSVQELTENRGYPERRFPHHINSGQLSMRKAQYLKESIRKSSSNKEPILDGNFATVSSNRYTDLEVSIGYGNGKISSEPNFAALDSAVAELGHPMQTFNSSSSGCGRFPTNDMSSTTLSPKKIYSHSPSPDAMSDSSSNYGAPSGLPHPKPKHNIREQLIQAGFELRGNGVYTNRISYRFSGTTNFPIPSNGGVASRISEFEKRPGAPNLLQIACALGGLSGASQRKETSARSPLGPMSPRSSIYRTKPIIYADLGSTSKPYGEVNGGSAIVFEFPSKLDEIPYYSREDASCMRETKIPAAIDNFVFNEVHENNKSFSEENKELFKSSSLAERRYAKKLTNYEQINIPSSSNLVRPKHVDKASIEIPRFHFPKGKPVPSLENEAALRRVADVFDSINGKAALKDMEDICRAARVPIYWKKAVFNSCNRSLQQSISFLDFSSWWNRMTAVAHDEASRFVFTLAGPNRNHLTKEDFAPMLQDLIDTFPGLHFLREAQEFHARYVETVTVRIFWSVNRSWSGRITANELRRSNFLEVVRKLERTDDINTVTDYFSYEHFYVIYCKFYELDKDHDLIINKVDMSMHANGALPLQIIDRIFSGAVTRSLSGRRSRSVLETICYTDFVAFLLAEEDKKHPTSIEYWFRCLDLDGDGFISLYEMEYFYSGVKSKMDQHNIDSMRFEDVVCNLMDLIQPSTPNAISLSDLKRCSLCTRFFNTFVNWVKYYEQESSEGERATVTDGEEELSDWDRYCLEEYEVLMTDEQDEPEDINLNLDDDDDLINGTNVTTTVSMTLRDFNPSKSTMLEAL